MTEVAWRAGQQAYLLALNRRAVVIIHGDWMVGIY
jgi:hypothetical protein